MEIQLSHMDDIYNVLLTREKDVYVISVDQKEYRVKDFLLQGCRLTFEIGESRISMYIVQDADRNYISFNGEYYIVERARAAKTGIRGVAAQHASSVSSPMPGLLMKLPVTIGTRVSAGQTLAIVEAMKMQNELRAPRDGIVEKINFKEGDQVDAFQPIVELEPQAPQ